MKNQKVIGLSALKVEEIDLVVINMDYFSVLERKVHWSLKDLF